VRTPRLTLALLKANVAADRMAINPPSTRAISQQFFLERDDFSSNRHPALRFWWSMIFPKTGIHFSGSCCSCRLVRRGNVSGRKVCAGHSRHAVGWGEGAIWPRYPSYIEITTLIFLSGRIFWRKTGDHPRLREGMLFRKML
jgi:hypothetical protein